MHFTQPVVGIFNIFSIYDAISIIFENGSVAFHTVCLIAKMA